MVNNFHNTSHIKSKPQRRHNELELDKTDDNIMIYHQNIRGLRNKRTEMLNSLLPELPQILCITEHHLREFELESSPIEDYKLGAKFCRENLKDGGTCIFVHESVSFITINLQEFSKEQDIEVCAIKIYLPTSITTTGGL